MTDNSALLPPIRLITQRLTQNQRERRRLRTLLRLALEVDDEQGPVPAEYDHAPTAVTKAGDQCLAGRRHRRRSSRLQSESSRPPIARTEVPVEHLSTELH
jgi:hypothetical protein